MPESVRHPEFAGRSLGWNVNTVREPAGWSPREYDNIKTLCQMAGLKGAIRWRDYRDHGTFVNMLSDLGDDTAGADRYTVLVPDNVVIASAVVVPGNITLVRVQSGRFTIAAEASITFTDGSKLITEPEAYLFNVEGSSSWIGKVIVASSAIEFFTPEMFGGGEAGLVKIESAVTMQTGVINIRILKDLVINGYAVLSNKVDLEYIKPGVLITVENGGELGISKMTSKHCHNPFEGSAGTVGIGGSVEGVRTPFVVMRSGMTPNPSRLAEEVVLYPYVNEGVVELRMRVGVSGLYAVSLSTVT